MNGVRVNVNTGNEGVLNKNDQILLRLGIEYPGSYLIWGKVQLLNLDEDSQPAALSVVFVDDNKAVTQVDREIQVRLGGLHDGAAQVVVPFHGWVRTQAEGTIEMHGRSFNATYLFPKLSSLFLDQLTGPDD